MAGIFDFLFGSSNDDPTKSQGVLNNTPSPSDVNVDKPPVNNGILNQNTQVQQQVNPNSLGQRFQNADFGTHLMALARGLGAAGSRDPMKTVLDYAAQDAENRKLNIEAAKTKFTHIAGTPYFMSVNAAGKTAIVDSKGDPVQAGPNGQDPLDAWIKNNQAYQTQLWKDKADYKGEIDNRVSNSKLGNKQSLEDQPNLEAALGDVGVLRQVAAGLREKPDATGGWKSVLPKSVLDYVDPTAANFQQQAEGVALKSLRSIFGAQFTENEGKQFLARYYNPRLKPEQNADNLERMAGDIENLAKNKAAASEYLGKNGTLQGFTPTPNSNPNNPVRISGDDDFNKLAPGTLFIGPDGKTRRK